jgi:transcriptional/translational regulatory protein YebC/TACO1
MKATARRGGGPGGGHDRQPQPYRGRCAPCLQPSTAATWVPNGSVAYLFTKRGEIFFPAGVNEDKVMEVALESGADDVQSDEDGVTVITTPEAFGAVLDALEAANLKPESSEVTMSPSTQSEITDVDQAEKIMKMIDMLEDLDDVQNVYTNADFSADVMAALNK